MIDATKATHEFVYTFNAPAATCIIMLVLYLGKLEYWEKCNKHCNTFHGIRETPGCCH
jgi:hypothetical protein